MAKATHEIHNSLEGVPEEPHPTAAASLGMVLLQIALLDIVFSLDSVITAVGLVEHVSIMAAGHHPGCGGDADGGQGHRRFRGHASDDQDSSLSFLILVGVTLMVEGFDVHVPKGYIYFSNGFRDRRDAEHTHAQKTRATPIKLHSRYAEEPRR